MHPVCDWDMGIVTAGVVLADQAGCITEESIQRAEEFGIIADTAVLSAALTTAGFSALDHTSPALRLRYINLINGQ